MEEKLKIIYNKLYSFFGPQNWWPADTPFEVCIGAILTQNTNWNNVEKAINNIKKNRCLDPQKLLNMDQRHLEELIKPSGFYRQKAKRIKNFCEFLIKEGGIEAVSKYETYVLREKLLSIKGIGAETADSILLYAFERPVFVVDSYTYRILSRHNLVEENINYEQLQSLFMDNLPNDTDLFKEYHALIVETAKKFCKNKNPLCKECPLNGI